MATMGFALQSPTLGILRDVGLPLVAVAAAFVLPFHYLVNTFIIVGQAHFAMALLYQYRGKRIDRRYLVAAAVIATALVSYFVLTTELIPLLIAISILFSFHFSWDEMALHNERMTRARLITVLGFTISFFLLTLLFAFPTVAWVPTAALGVALGAIALRFMVSREQPARGEWYVWFVQALLFALALVFGLSGHVLALIVIIHVVNWYIAYGVKLSGNPERAARYWKEVGVFLIVFSALFFVYWEWKVDELWALFAIGPYYAWAIAHILLSYVLLLPRRVQAA